MNEMAKPIGLMPRGNGFTFRIHVPKDLQGHFEYNGSKTIKDIWVTLETSDYKSACSKAILKAAEFEKRFEDARIQLKKKSAPITVTADLLSTLSDSQLYVLARGWVEKIDAAHEKAILEQGRPEDLELHILDLKIDLSEAEIAYAEDNLSYVSKIAKKYLLEQEIGFEESSPAFKKFCRIFLEGMVEEAQKALKRGMGEVTPEYINPKFKPTEPLSLTTSKTFDEVKEMYLTFKQDILSEKRLNETRAMLDIISELFGKGFRMSNLDAEKSDKMAALLKKMPSNVRKKYPENQFTLIEAIDRGKKSGAKTISVSSYNKYISAFSGMMQWARRRKYVEDIFVEDLRVREDVRQAEKKLPFSDEQLKSIFRLDEFVRYHELKTSSKSNSSKDKADEKFWVSLIALFMGMRLGEICQLDVNDLEEQDGILVIKITENMEDYENEENKKRLKTRGSNRTIPVHPELIKIGFKTFWQNQKKRNAKKLFPSVKPVNGSWSHKHSGWFSEKCLPKAKAKTAKHTFHSFRHNFRNAERRAELPKELADFLGGWKTDGVSSSYGDMNSAYSTKQLYDAISKIKYEGLDLSHLYPKHRER
ncbi:MAG TPA: site-specific integrase [Micavibrio sp.]|nr:site-specific integrase [Micavibrio sp.]HIL29292.1 site-specific integrase [Micavibrio sp.]